MKRRLFKSVSLLLALVLTLTMFSGITAFAASETDDCKINVFTGGLTPENPLSSVTYSGNEIEFFETAVISNLKNGCKYKVTVTLYTSEGSKIYTSDKLLGAKLVSAQTTFTATSMTDMNATFTSMQFDGSHLNGKTVYLKWDVENLTGSTKARVYTKGKNFKLSFFNDVPANTWYSEAVDWARGNEIVNGTSATTFSPSAPMTRAMIATVLYRLCGDFEPAASGGNMPFKDVSESSYYYDAVKWCYNLGIITGTTATTFSPNENVTREQIAAIIYRAYKAFEGSGASSPSGSLSQFPDASQVSSYAKEAMLWCVKNNIISGVASNNKTLLAPKSTATRAQVVTILMRAWKNCLRDAMRGIG